MGRPSSFDRDAAIETAMQEMWRHGYNASSVKAISETLGIKRSSYYNAFGSREELFKEALTVYFAQSPDRILHGELPEMPVLELLTSTFRAICAARAGDPEGRGCLVINSLTELDESDAELRDLIIGAVLSGAARLEVLLSIAVQNGELPETTNVHAKALALQNLMVGINVFSKALRDEEQLWLSVKTTLEGLGLSHEGNRA